MRQNINADNIDQTKELLTSSSDNKPASATISKEQDFQLKQAAALLVDSFFLFDSIKDNEDHQK